MRTNLDELGLVEGLAQLIPQCARRILHAGLTSGTLAESLRARSGAKVAGLHLGPSTPNQPMAALDSLHTIGTDNLDLPFAAGQLDGIIVETMDLSDETLRGLLQQLVPLLSDEGFLLLIVVGATETDSPRTKPAMAALVDAAGLAFYTTNDIELERRSFDAGNDPANPATRGFLLWAVRPSYNPLEHARRLFKAGHPGWAYEVLDLVPDALVQEPDVRAAYYSERHMCLLAWDKVAEPQGRLGRFFNGQSMFYEATWNAPAAPLPYLCQAEFWRRIGNEDMAARLLRTIRHVAPHPEIDRRLETVIPAEPPSGPRERAPDWQVPDRLPRVLFILPGRPHYGLDVLYDGLCTVLGDENVIDLPWKSTLHGDVPRELANYPCTFNRRGAARSFDRVVEELRRGAFDFFLMGDVEQQVGGEAMRALLDAAPKLPVFVVDEQDDPLDNLPDTLAFLGCDRVRGYFKREMLACWDYGTVARPLPFAYADHKVPEALTWDRDEPLFWAGHRQFGLRRLYVERMEQRLRRSFDRKYVQDEYARALHGSRIGLNLFGFGFDTVRYWELPAHGCMLLSERLPIRIPHNFVDGESAVFFDDLPSMEAKLDFYMNHPAEAEAIARRGHDVLKQHHTASARARQMLAYADELLRES